MQSNLIPIILILSIVAVGVLGSFIFGLSGHSGNMHNFCPVATMWGQNCSSMNSSFTLAFHHLSWLKQSMQGIVSIGFGMLTVFNFLIILLFITLAILFDKVTVGIYLLYQKHWPTKTFQFGLGRQLLRWLALRNKRDPYAVVLGA